MRAAFLIFLVVLSGCRSAADAPPAPQVVESQPQMRLDTLYAVLWMQTAAEFEALTRQTWRAATEAMREGLEGSFPSAVVDSHRSCGDCPPAVIVDVDETVLDNSPHDARRVLDGQDFDPVVWTAWVNERRARETPGALDFAREAERLGVTVFYVTNRTQEEEAGTRDNLRALGFRLPQQPDTILTKGERSASVTSDKSERRRWVAENYRVLVLAGDDLNDFVPANLGVAEREALVERHRARWGAQWFMLPNPSYGSWERALLRDLPSGADRQQRLRHLLQALEPEENGS